MNKNVEEQLSALVDGEVAEHELPPLLAKMRSNAELRERWTRYHLISDALHNSLPSAVDHGLQARVWSALQDEPAIVAPKRRTHSHGPWVKQAIGIAVAASVTAVAILSFQAINSGPGATSAALMASGTQTPPLDSVATSSDAETDVALDPYLVNHNEHAVSAGMHGMLPYVRLVSQGSAE